MTFLVIFNGHKQGEEKIYAKSWKEFIDQLNRIVEMYRELPDLIYLKDPKL